MNADVIRLFEHIKLLQRGVELYQKERDSDCSALPNGLNGKNVRIGLLGATSAGKTTFIKRLLSGSAGKISSRPETACLVVHSFTESESLTFRFRAAVRFDDAAIGRDFTQFLKSYRLSDCYDKLNVHEWCLKEESEESREYTPTEILSFFEQVNKFGEVFSKITWNHKKRKTSYNITDLIDIYDLPGFGGRDEHDRAVHEVFECERFDVLVYLIDTSCGIPSKEEIDHLNNVREYLSKNKGTSFYWAYEKPSPDMIDFDDMAEQIQTAVSKNGVEIEAKGLLNFIGQENGDDDELRSRVMVDILKPYFVQVGKKYLDNAYAEAKKEAGMSNRPFNKLFMEDEVWPVISTILNDVEAREKAKKATDGTGLSRSEVKRKFRESFMGSDECSESDEKPTLKNEKDLNVGVLGKLKGFSRYLSRKTKSQAQDSSALNDRMLAIKETGSRIDNAIDAMVDAIFNIDGTLSLTKMPLFKKEVYLKKAEIRMLGYDAQFYWMLKDPNGVVGFIKEPIAVSLRDNIDGEITAIEEFEIEEDVE